MRALERKGCLTMIKDGGEPSLVTVTDIAGASRKLTTVGILMTGVEGSREPQPALRLLLELGLDGRINYKLRTMAGLTLILNMSSLQMISGLMMREALPPLSRPADDLVLLT